MAKARGTLTLKSTPKATTSEAATLIEAPTCYARNGTEIIFTATAALICHAGQASDDVDLVRWNVDALLVPGAFDRLAATGTIKLDGDLPLDDPATMYALIVDADLLAVLDAENAAAIATQVSDAVAPTPESEPAFEAAFIEDVAFSSKPADVAAEQPAEQPAERAPRETTAFEKDLGESEITFSNTVNGAVYAAIRTPGGRTMMAYGEIAEAIRGRSSIKGTLVKTRSTDKIVSLSTDAGEIVETPRLAA